MKEKLQKVVQSLKIKIDKIQSSSLYTAAPTRKRMNQIDSNYIKIDKMKRIITIVKSLIEDNPYNISSLSQIEIFLFNKYPEPSENSNDWYVEICNKYKRAISKICDNKELFEEIKKYILDIYNWVKVEKDIQAMIKKQLLNNIPWYFPTPMEIVRKMVELADIQEWEIILEPSAWTGNIIDWIIEKYPKNIIYINEWNYSNYEILKEKYTWNWYMYWFNDDFMTFEKMQYFNKIIMNPPFENKQDQKHILKARELLKKWWIIVAIASAWVKYRSDYQEFRDFIDKYWYVEDLDAWTFKESWTMVNSVLIYLKK